MDGPDFLASLGVTLLMIAFAANALGYWAARHPLYLGLNALGAAIAAYAAALLGVIPFLVLEGFWAVVALLSLIRLWLAPAKS